MFTRPTIDYYYNSGVGGAYEYRNSRMGATTSEWVHVSGSGYTSNSSTDPYHNHFDYPLGPAVGSDNHPVELLEDPSFIGTKAECVLGDIIVIISTYSITGNKLTGTNPSGDSIVFTKQ